MADTPDKVCEILHACFLLECVTHWYPCLICYAYVGRPGVLRFTVLLWRTGLKLGSCYLMLAQIRTRSHRYDIVKCVCQVLHSH